MNRLNHNSDNERSDEELVAMLCSAVCEQEALEQIFHRYHKQLYHVAYSILRNEAIAKDVVQDIFIDLWNRRDHSVIKNLSGYLQGAIKFQVLKHLRNGKIRDRHLAVMEAVKFVNATEEAINFSELERILKDSVEMLPPRCKEVFMLSRFENLTNKEISDRLNISTKTVEGQLTKALSFLKSQIKGITFLLLILLTVLG